MTQQLQILLLTTGFIAGLCFLPALTRVLDPESVHRFFDALGHAAAAPFQRAGRIFLRVSLLGKAHSAPCEADRQVDAREQRISDAAEAIRSMMLILTAAIERTAQAATTSSRTLDELRGAVNRMGLPPELALTASHLVAQIDRVIDSNCTLKGKLASSQEILTTQQHIIEDLRTAVRIDGMTRLASRSYFDDKLAEEIKLKQRYNEAFFLMIIDVDNFKTINDSYGHQAGDRILKGVAFKIQNALRDSDFVARFGGDEFALILIKATLSSATSVAWKLCESIRDSRFLLDDIEVKVTISIGAAEAVVQDTEESLIRRADAALYQVKQQGRNCVRFADLPAAQDPGAGKPLRRPTAG